MAVCQKFDIMDYFGNWLNESMKGLFILTSKLIIYKTEKSINIIKPIEVILPYTCRVEKVKNIFFQI